MHRRVQEIIRKSEEAKRTGEDVPIHVKHYDAMNSSEREEFQKLVGAGGEVRTDGLAGRMKEAYLLAYAVKDDRLVAGGAMKRPAGSYVRKISRCSGYDLNGYQAELGWIYVFSETRGMRLASRISEALCNSDESSIFATTRADNKPMHAILDQLAFKKMGTEYDSNEHPSKKIQLWCLQR